jgi:hypothetical protein
MNPNSVPASVSSVPSVVNSESAPSASSAVKIPLVRLSDGTAKVGPWRLSNIEANDVDSIANCLRSFHNHESRVRILASLVLIFRENLDDAPAPQNVWSSDPLVPRGTTDQENS